MNYDAFIVPPGSKISLRKNYGTKLEELNLQYPTVSEEHRQQVLLAKLILEQEDEEVNSTDQGNKK
jgi:hypothetical protein